MAPGAAHQFSAEPEVSALTRIPDLLTLIALLI
jgi:hypothetical protein